MIENVVVLQFTMAIIIEIDADLLARVNAIAAQHRRTASCYPHTGQRIRIHFVLFD